MDEPELNTEDAAAGDVSAHLEQLIHEAKEILDILVPLANEGILHKEIFSAIKREIETSKADITQSKGANTKYLNELKKREEEVSKFIESTASKTIEISNLIKDVEDQLTRCDKDATAIDKLRTAANDNKKLVTEIKNDALGLVESIKLLSDEWLDKITELRSEKAEGNRIAGLLKKREEEVESLYNTMDAKYSYLFKEKDELGITRIQSTDNAIGRISDFDRKITKEINPELNRVSIDIKNKSIEIESLLSKAVAGALDKSYLEAMEEYSTPASKALKDKKEWKRGNIWGNTCASIENCWIRLYNLTFRHAKELINYAFFIAPLGVAVAMMVGIGDQKYFNDLVELLTQKNTVPVSVLELLLLKALISLPLFWISWYGYGTLVQRKRLYEEYNHKSRVVRMYLMFDKEGNHYRLDLRKELEMTLIEAIKKNPAESFDKKGSVIELLIEALRKDKSSENAKELISVAIPSILKELRAQGGSNDG